jgi:hypothetical protein
MRTFFTYVSLALLAGRQRPDRAFSHDAGIIGVRKAESSLAGVTGEMLADLPAGLTFPGNRSFSTQEYGIILII